MKYPKSRYTGEKPWMDKDALRAIYLRYTNSQDVRQLAAKPRKRKVQRLSREGVHRKRLTVEVQGDCHAVRDIVRSLW